MLRDMSSAFVTVDHSIMLDVLMSRFGIYRVKHVTGLMTSYNRP